MAEKKKTVLVAPLNWGLGHATRCIPIIKELNSLGHNVIIAATGRGLWLLQKEFPNARFIDFSDYDIKYPKNGSMALYMLLRSPLIFYKIYKEHLKLASLIKEHKIDFVISDNRFGLFNKSVKTLYITHQPVIKAPGFIEDLLKRIHKQFIKQYDYCWIPDFEGENNLGGDLTHAFKPLKNTAYVGCISRFNKIEIKQKQFDVLVLLSGPEPQRTLIEELIIQQIQNTNYKAVVIRGMTEGKRKRDLTPNIKLIDSATTIELENYISESACVILRGGYCSIADFYKIGRPVAFIPTPGQTEQEYLAKYLNNTMDIPWATQNQFDIKQLIERAMPIKTIGNFSNNLKLNIERLL